MLQLFMWTAAIVSAAAAPCVAGFDDLIFQHAGSRPASVLQLHWSFPPETPHLEHYFLALQGLCDLYPDNTLTAIIYLDHDCDFDPGGFDLVVKTDTRGLNILTEGLAVLAPSTQEILFRSSSGIGLLTVVQVLDAHLGSTNGTPGGVRRLFMETVQSLYAGCARAFCGTDEEQILSLCDLVGDERVLIFVPPGCTECQLEKYKPAILSFFGDDSPWSREVFILSMDYTKPALSRLFADREQCWLTQEGNPQTVLLAALAQNVRLRPVVFRLDGAGRRLWSELGGIDP